MLKLKKFKKITPSQRDALKDVLSKKIDRYIPSITFLTEYQQKKFEEDVWKKKFIVLMKLLLTININLI